MHGERLGLLGELMIVEREWVIGLSRLLVQKGWKEAN